MKRGYFRIISGTVMIIFQILAIAAESSVVSTVHTNMWTDIGFYSVGITGAILLVFGIRAHNNGFYSQLILHDRTKKIHAVTKWIFFSISSLLFVFNVLSFISSWPEFNVVTILMIFATLSFELYLLLYVYKKPCCLLSATLIFMGVAYLYDFFSNITYYIFHLYGMENYALYVVFGIIPRLMTGILYIIIAAKLYKEKFSVNVIKTLGWIAFGLEMINRVLCNLVVFHGFYFYHIRIILFILFTVGLLLYISVFKMNTLQATSVKDDIDSIRFCRKCGSRLFSDSAFCSQCGTQIGSVKLK